MAKYTINHTCGHTSAADIYGTNVRGERDRKVAHLESTPCDACYAKAQASKGGAQVDEIEMHYSEYKNEYASCKTKPGSYDAKAKTIVVYVPAKAETAEAVEATADQATAEINAAAEAVITILEGANATDEEKAEVVNQARWIAADLIRRLPETSAGMYRTTKQKVDYLRVSGQGYGGTKLGFEIAASISRNLK